MSLKNYGLIGKHLAHSFSPEYFTHKFLKEGIQASYKAFEIQEEDLGKFLSNTDCLGLNVTIPYKETVLQHLDEIEETAKSISSVNTIKLYPDGRKIGFNTDHIGFAKSLNRWDLGKVSKALVLGSGGASKAINYVLNEQGIEITQVSRDKKEDQLSYAELDEKLIQEHLLIINCTPLGMYPRIDGFPDIPYETIGIEHFIYDLVYNPAVTQFLKRSEAAGAKTMNGLEMLQIQAEESWKIWNDPTI